MNGDLLERAARALSVEADAAPAPAPATRARVLLRLADRRRRPGRRVGLVLGSLLLLSGSLALATAGVPAAARAWRIMVEKLAPKPVASTEAAPARSDQRPSGPRIQRLAATSSPAEAAAVPAASPLLARPSSPTLALFHRAHQLHFRQRDAAAALAAWDHYLRVDPEGPLVLEGRYNRALCLVRLGRADEARAALEPFADGALAHYRMDEARLLMQSLAVPAATPSAAP